MFVTTIALPISYFSSAMFSTPEGLSFPLTRRIVPLGLIVWWRRVSKKNVSDVETRRLVNKFARVRQYVEELAVGAKMQIRRPRPVVFAVVPQKAKLSAERDGSAGRRGRHQEPLAAQQDAMAAVARSFRVTSRASTFALS
jgi:hypothetical protein